MPGSGGKGCGAGALGEASGEYAAQVYGDAIQAPDGSPFTSQQQQDIVGLAQVVGAVAAAATGQSANNVMIAASLGADAAVNNYLLHATGLAAINSACHSSQSAACSLAQNVSQSQAQLTSLHKGPWEIVQNVGANGNIVAYSAYNPATGKTDWVMDPADLPGFMSSNTGALQLSSTTYYQSPDYAISGNLAAQEVKSGNYQSGLGLYAQSWGDALTNPGWWASVVAGASGGAVEAEAAARAGGTTGSVVVGSTADSVGVTSSTGVNFYVTSDGTAVPATGYRAVGGPAVSEIETGVIFPRNPGTYITFNNITNLTRSEVQSLLQMQQTPTNWVTFDTLPLIPDLKIPTGEWNTSTVPEPLTSTFPQYGSGGGTQAITTQPIKINGSGSLSVGASK